MEDKLKVWIARDKDGGLFAFPSIPLKKASIWSPGLGINMMQLKSDKFPSVKWEDDEPTEAYITLAEPQEEKEIDLADAKTVNRRINRLIYRVNQLEYRIEAAEILTRRHEEALSQTLVEEQTQYKPSNKIPQQ